MKTMSFLVKPGSKVDLDLTPTRDHGGLDKEEGRERFDRAVKKLDDLQELLYAESKHGLLLVLQAMDAGGKDSTIRSVLGPLNPQGVQVASFKAPSSVELAHDFLWRIHAHAPRKGHISVFNRSHYEDVLIVRVKSLVPEARWRARYEHINAFEKMLHDEGATIRKVFLHISKDYQKERFERRLKRPDKHWKFNPADLAERARWDDYQKAIEDAISATSTPWAPWYVIPAEHHWFRNLVVAEMLVETLESLDMKYPEIDYDPKTIRIED